MHHRTQSRSESLKAIAVTSVIQSPAIMSNTTPTRQYALGSTEGEHERLIRQSARLAPFTERDRRVLAALIRMMDNTLGFTARDRHVERGTE